MKILNMYVNNEEKHLKILLTTRFALFGVFSLKWKKSKTEENAFVSLRISR